MSAEINPFLTAWYKNGFLTNAAVAPTNCIVFMVNRREYNAILIVLFIIATAITISNNAIDKNKIANCLNPKFTRSTEEES